MNFDRHFEVSAAFCYFLLLQVLRNLMSVAEFLNSVFEMKMVLLNRKMPYVYYSIVSDGVLCISVTVNGTG